MVYRNHPQMDPNGIGIRKQKTETCRHVQHLQWFPTHHQFACIVLEFAKLIQGNIEMTEMKYVHHIIDTCLDTLDICLGKTTPGRYLVSLIISLFYTYGGWLRNPALVDRWLIPWFIGCQPSKVVQDFETIHSIMVASNIPEIYCFIINFHTIWHV